MTMTTNPSSPLSAPVGVEGLVKLLERIRDLLSSLPADCLGSGTGANGQPYPIRDEVVHGITKALAQQSAMDGCHCRTCTCNPNMTPAVRYDLSPAQKEGVIRDHLIRLGWTPPDERAQHAAPTPVVDWTSLTAAQKEAWGRKMFQEAARGLWRCRSVTDQLLHWRGVPVHVTGTVTTSPGNWALIDELSARHQEGDDDA